MAQLLVPVDVATNAGSSQGSRDIDHLSLAQRLSRASDPLGDVITWLDSVDLGDELGEDLNRVWQETGGTGLCGESLFGVRELLADTPSEGTAAVVANPKSRCGEAQSLPRTPAARPHDSSTRSPGSPHQRQQSRGVVRSCCFDMGRRVEGEARNFSINDQNEEEEWDARQKQTGAAGRLVVYSEGDRPRDDLLLRGGAGRRVIVTAVTEDGKAHKAGVKAGDVLVSINGKKDFTDKTADVIHAGLTAPVMLVFMGFVGKLQAEVRLNYAEKVAGMASQQQVVFGRPDAPVQVIDEVVFQPSSAPLFLTTSAPQSSSPAQAATAIQTQPPSQPLGLPAGPSTLSDGLPNIMKPVSTTPLISLDSLDLVGPTDNESAEAGSPRAAAVLREDTVGAQSSEAPPAESSAAPVYLGAPTQTPHTPVCSSPRPRASPGKLPPTTRDNTVASCSDADSMTTASTRGDQAPNAVYELQVGEARHLVQQALARVRAQEKLEEQMHRDLDKRSVEDIMSFAQVRRTGSGGAHQRCDIWERPQAPQAPRSISDGSGGAGAFSGRFKEEEGPAKPSDAVGVEATAPPSASPPNVSSSGAFVGPGVVGLMTSPESARPAAINVPTEAAPFTTAAATFVNHGGNQGDTSPAPLDHSRSSEPDQMMEITDPSGELL